MGSVNGTTTLQIKLTTDGQGQVVATLDQVQQKVASVAPAAVAANSELGKIGATLESIKKIGEAWGIYEIVKIAVEAFAEANAEATKLQTTLIAVTGSAAAAKAAYEEIGSVARSTGATNDELTQSWVRLANIGIQPTAELLKSLATVAVATNRDVVTVADAFAMAAEGHARGLTQLGVETKEVGDKVIVSFQGQSQIINNTKEGISQYIESLGKTPAAIEAMNEKLNSTGGQWDQLKKAASDFFEALGGGGASAKMGMVASLMKGIVGEVDQLTEITRNLGKGSGLMALFDLGSGNTAGFAQLAAQAHAVTVEFEDQKEAVADTAKEYAPLMETLISLAGGADTLRAALSSLTGEFRSDAAEAEKHKEESLQNSNALSKLAKSLGEQGAALGGSAVARVQYAIATQTGAAADKEAQQAALKAAAAYDQKNAALKSAAEYQRQVAQDTAYIEKLQLELDALGHTSEYMELLTAQEKAEKAATDDAAKSILAKANALYQQKEAMDEIQLLQKTNDTDTQKIDAQIAQNKSLLQSYQDALGGVDKVTQAEIKYTQAVNDVRAAEQQGIITHEQAQAAIKKLAGGLIDASTGAAAYKQAFNSLLDQLGNDAGSVLSDLMVNGMKDAGPKLLQESQNIFKQLNDFWIKQKIIIPLQQQMEGKGDGPSGGNLAMGGIALAGSAVGGAVGGKAGGFITGAAGGAVAGAEIGSIIPGIGTAIGAVVGAILGGILGAVGAAGDKTPSFTIGGKGNADPNALYGGKFSDYLGTFGLRGKHITDDMQRQLEASITSFDDSLSGLIPPELVDQVKTRIQQVNTTFTGSSPDEVEKAHLDAVMSVVAPELQQFVDGLTNVQDRLKAFGSLLQLKDEFGALASAITQISGSPIDKVVDQMKQLDKAVTDAQGDLQAAIKTQDPTAILSAEQTLKQAILNRYQQEIQLVQQIEQSLSNLSDLAYSMSLNIDQKIAAINGDQSGVISDASGRMSSLQNTIGTDTDPADVLNLLGDFTDALDTWLQASTQAVNDALNDQISAIEAQKSALQDQYNDEQQARQQLMINTQAARQKTIADLQQQLTIAQAWAAVLDHERQTVQSIITGTSNPLGGYSQAASLETIISNLFHQVQHETGQQQATDASTLIDDLQQRLQLIQSGNLYDRSSPEYMKQYNATLAQLEQVKQLAPTVASQTDILQHQLDALQKITGFSQTSSQAMLKTQAEINALNQQEDAAKQQAKDQIDQLNANAVSYYSWAKGEAEQAEQQRHDELMAQLKAITGGLDPNEYIAQETAREVALLQSIDDNLSDYLKAISSGGTSTGTGTGNGPGGNGPGGGDPVSPYPIHTNNIPAPIVNVTINGTGMGSQDIAAAVNDGLAVALPGVVPALKRMLKTA